MAMTVIWTGMVVTAVLCGMATGQGTQVALAALEGAQAAVELSISMMGALCLWSGTMEVMRRSGLAQKVSRLLQPVLRLMQSMLCINSPNIFSSAKKQISPQLS